VRKLAIGNPQTVPAGQYAQQLLTNLKLWEQLQPKLVLAEDVRQVLDYVARGEVEAGIVYASDVVAAQDKVVVAARAPADKHDPILYPIALVKESRHTDAARQFIALVLSPEGQAALTKYGFIATTR
jgi:molybdate transport system substrate-binding protein